jgi:hypothetical protein
VFVANPEQYLNNDDDGYGTEVHDLPELDLETYRQNDKIKG